MDFAINFKSDGKAASDTTTAVQKGFEGIHAAAGKLQARLVGLYAAKEAADFVGEVIHATAEIGEMAEMVGVSAEKYQMWKAAIKGTPASIEEVGNALKFLKLSIVEASGNANSPAASWFKFFGIGIGELKASRPEDIFDKVAAAAGRMGPTAQRTAALMNLLGRSAESLGPAFSKGFMQSQEAAKAAGSIIEDDVVERVHELEKSWQRMMAASTGVMSRLIARGAGASSGQGAGVMDTVTEMIRSYGAAFNNDDGTPKVGATGDPQIKKLIEFNKILLGGPVALLYNAAQGSVESNSETADNTRAMALYSGVRKAGGSPTDAAGFRRLIHDAESDPEAKEFLKKLDEMIKEQRETTNAVKNTL